MWCHTLTMIWRVIHHAINLWWIIMHSFHFQKKVRDEFSLGEVQLFQIEFAQVSLVVRQVAGTRGAGRSRRPRTRQTSRRIRPGQFSLVLQQFFRKITGQNIVIKGLAHFVHLFFGETRWCSLNTCWMCLLASQTDVVFCLLFTTTIDYFLRDVHSFAAAIFTTRRTGAANRPVLFFSTLRRTSAVVMVFLVQMTFMVVPPVFLALAACLFVVVVFPQLVSNFPSQFFEKRIFPLRFIAIRHYSQGWV